MSEPAVCTKKPKKAKKKKQLDVRQLSLSSIPELVETSSSQDILQKCQVAAETVLADVIIKAVHLSLGSSCDDSLLGEQTGSEEVINDEKHFSDLNEINKQVELLQEENEIETASTDSSTLKTVTDKTVADHVDVVLLENDETKQGKTEISTSKQHDQMACKTPIEKFGSVVVSGVYPKLTSKKQTEKSDDSSAYLNETKVLNQGEEQQTRTLKPSVFVSRDKPYSSSLQTCHWDRTKYNVVLLPDLKKVVYPDLDSLMLTKSYADPFSAHGSFMGHENFPPSTRTVDRSSKPKTLAVYNTEINVIDHSTVTVETPTHKEPVMSSHNEVKISNTRLMADAKDPRFVDYCIDGVDFRVFMNPVTWSPVDNSQLVVFRVGPLYFEEFFTSCDTVDGLLRAIKERAEQLANRQLTLAQKCLLTNVGEGNFFRIPNATLVIYASHSEFKWESKSHLVRFGVNEAFYEEHFQNCKSFEDVIKAVKTRAEIICARQRILKAKAYSGKESVSENNAQEMCNTENKTFYPMLNIENYDFNDGDTNYKRNEKPVEEAGSGSNALKSDKSGDQSDQRQGSSGFKRKLASVGQWLKGAFSKKTDKPGSSSNVHGRPRRKPKPTSPALIHHSYRPPAAPPNSPTYDLDLY